MSERIKIHLFVDQKQRLILPVSASPLIEKTILVPGVDPVQLYGVNDVHLDLFRTFFPGLKIVARGLEMKLTGEEKDVLLFETKLNQLVAHNQLFGGLG